RFAVQHLVPGLAAVVPRLDVGGAAEAAATLLEAIKAVKNPYELPPLVEGLSAVAARLDPKDAAQVAAVLTRAIKDAKDPNTLARLAQCLSTAATRMDPDAAAAAVTEVAAVVSQALVERTGTPSFGDRSQVLATLLSNALPTEVGPRAASLVGAA